ncbi:MAG: hypothetical protein ACI9U2_003195, partial [Bradymonadia bacterium]
GVAATRGAATALLERLIGYHKSPSTTEPQRAVRTSATRQASAS